MAAPRDPRVVLEQMLEAILDIEQIVAGRSFEGYAGDRPARRAVERCIEIVSEASRRLPADLKARHPAIPWRKDRRHPLWSTPCRFHKPETSASDANMTLIDAPSGARTRAMTSSRTASVASAPQSD